MDLMPNINEDVVEKLIEYYDLGPEGNVNTLVAYLGGIMQAFSKFVREQEDEIDEDYTAEGKRLILEKMRQEHSKYSNHFLAIVAANTTVKDLYL